MKKRSMVWVILLVSSALSLFFVDWSTETFVLVGHGFALGAGVVGLASEMAESRHARR